MNIKLDADDIVPDGTAFIASYPTGILYSVQAGGMGCSHPECEGFVINMGDFGDSFDDCHYGCSDLSYESELRQRLAPILDSYLRIESIRTGRDVRFDFDRIDELKEGWWPVLLHGYKDFYTEVPGTLKGYIHTGNCD